MTHVMRRLRDRVTNQLESRHQSYLDENVRIKAELYAMAEQPGVTPAEKQLINQMFTVSMPKMVEAQIAAQTTAIPTLPDTQLKARLCVDYAESITDGKWDLKKNDPVVAKFLDERLKRRGK